MPRVNIEMRASGAARKRRLRHLNTFAAAMPFCLMRCAYAVYAPLFSLLIAAMPLDAACRAAHAA